MAMDWLTRLGLKTVLDEWSRGERKYEEVEAWLEERFGEGVDDHTPYPGGQIPRPTSD